MLALAAAGPGGLGVIGACSGLCCAFAPAAYVLDADGLRIARRLLSPVLLPYARVRCVKVERFAAAPAVTWRFGSWPPWGIFAYYGRFKAGRLGWIRAYATSWKGEMVVVETGREPWYLSPAELERFCAALREGLGGNEITQWEENGERKPQRQHSGAGCSAI